MARKDHWYYKKLDALEKRKFEEIKRKKKKKFMAKECDCSDPIVICAFCHTKGEN